jgi:hypothetical protein
MSTDAGTPTYVLPVLGFRVWCVDDDGRLWPRTSKAAMMRRLGSEPWAIGTSHARCLLQAAGGAAHPAPANGCMCGLYGWHASKAALDACRTSRDLVAGAIIAWGDLQVHAAGFRAEYARPVALAVPAESSRLRRRARTRLEPLRRASERYAIPLVEGERLADEAGEHGAALAASAAPPPRLDSIRQRLARGLEPDRVGANRR